MQYISIGTACNVKYQIDKFFGGKETLFFDRLMTDMKSVNTILACDDICKIFFPENIHKIGVKGNNSRIKLKSLPGFTSIHDMGVDVNEKDITDFIDKYKRRHTRILEYIKGSEKLYFIRYGAIDEYNKTLFIQTIKNINTSCNFALISITIGQETNNIRKEENFLEINSTEILTHTDDWSTSDLNWENLFSTMKLNI